MGLTVSYHEIGSRSSQRASLMRVYAAAVIRPNQQLNILARLLEAPKNLCSFINGPVVSAVREHGLEGVVAKRADSIYEPGKRSGAWVKLPLKTTGTFLLGGFRRAEGMAVLLVGRFDDGRFKFAGKVTQGLRGMSRLELVAPEQLRLRKCPFVDLPNCKVDHFGEGVTAEEMGLFSWLRPEVSVEVAFNERTRAGALRHAELVGLV